MTLSCSREGNAIQVILARFPLLPRAPFSPGDPGGPIGPLSPFSPLKFRTKIYCRFIAGGDYLDKNGFSIWQLLKPTKIGKQLLA